MALLDDLGLISAFLIVVVLIGFTIVKFNALLFHYWQGEEKEAAISLRSCSLGFLFLVVPFMIGLFFYKVTPSIYFELFPDSHHYETILRFLSIWVLGSLLPATIAILALAVMIISVIYS